LKKLVDAYPYPYPETGEDAGEGESDKEPMAEPEKAELEPEKAEPEPEKVEPEPEKVEKTEPEKVEPEPEKVEKAEPEKVEVEKAEPEKVEVIKDNQIDDAIARFTEILAGVSKKIDSIENVQKDAQKAEIQKIGEIVVGLKERIEKFEEFVMTNVPIRKALAKTDEQREVDGPQNQLTEEIKDLSPREKLSVLLSKLPADA